jgi:hypothetical protein
MSTWIYKLIGSLLFATGITITITVNVDWSNDAKPPVSPDSLGWEQQAVPLAREVVESMPRFQIVGNDGVDNSKKNVRLWAFSQEVLGGRHIPNIAQQTGDCVSFASANAVMYLQAKQLALDRKPEQWHSIFPPHIYGGSRVTIGRGQIRGAGSVGAWAAEWVATKGVLQADAEGVPAYSGRLADEWGRKGVPAEFIAKSEPHTIGTVALVSSAADARDAICNGYPVTIASDFGTKTISAVDGRRVAKWNGRWMHAMTLIAYDGSGSKPYFYCLNSWGANAHPEPMQGEPPGGFWLTFNDVEKIVRQGDSFAYSDFAGFPAKQIDFSVFGANSIAATEQHESPWIQEANMPFATTLFGFGLCCLGIMLFSKHKATRLALAAIMIGVMIGSTTARAAEPVSFEAFGLNESKYAMTAERVSFAAFGVVEELPLTKHIEQAWTLDIKSTKQAIQQAQPLAYQPQWRLQCDTKGRCMWVWR